MVCACTAQNAVAAVTVRDANAGDAEAMAHQCGGPLARRAAIRDAQLQHNQVDAGEPQLKRVPIRRVVQCVQSGKAEAPSTLWACLGTRQRQSASLTDQWRRRT